MSGADETTALVGSTQYAQGLCLPNCDCLLTCIGCGCFPVYRAIVEAAPFTAVFIEITPKSATLWALIYGIGSCFAFHETVIFVLLYICFCIGLKDRLHIEESDLMTAIKAFCCAPCVMGQLLSTVRAQKVSGQLVGSPIRTGP